MSGIFHEGKWYKGTDLICRRCRRPVYESDNSEYAYQCFGCDEDLYGIETDERDGKYLPPVMVARLHGGITINEQLEYILEDDNETARIFKSQPEAEVFLLSQGIPAEDLAHLYFVECESAELAAALKAGHITILDVIEELNYRDRSGNKWNDFLFSYTTAELEKVENNAFAYVDKEAARRVFDAAKKLEREHNSEDDRTPDDIQRLFFNSDMVELFLNEKAIFAEHDDDPPNFEDMLISIIEQNIQNEKGAADNG